WVAGTANEPGARKCGREPLERWRAPRPRQVVAVEHEQRRLGRPFARRVQADRQPIGMREIQRPQEKRVEDAEEGDRRTNRQRQRRDHDDRERRRAAEDAQGVPQIARKIADHRLAQFARRTTIASVAALTTSGGVSKLFATIANASGSPPADVTKPDSERTPVIDPLFARAFPSAGVPFIRFAIVPSRPAIGSDASNGPRSFASPCTCARMVTSASGETKS